MRTAQLFLMAGALSCQNDCVIRLVDAGNDRNNTPLILAASKGMNTCVDLLLKKGANVNAIGENHWTPLFGATIGGHEACVNLLLNAGAEVNLRDIQHKTALSYSVMNGYLGCFRLLQSAGAGVNMADSEGITPLMTAATQVSLQFISQLLKAGAKIHLTNTRGRCALDCAMERYRDEPPKIPSDAETVTLLFASGEDFRYAPKGLLRRFLRHEAIRDFYSNRSLKDWCRAAIRNHLIHLNLRQHLFDRIPLLGLPTMVNEYLLYHTSLDP